jgi:hypothetical protein
MVGIDERLEGEQMKLRYDFDYDLSLCCDDHLLRPSMNKFRAHQEDEAEIEIAKAFDRPMVCMLSRSVHCTLDVPLNLPRTLDH